MIEIIVSSETLQIIIPKEMRSEAPLQLRDIWRDEFARSSNPVLELTEPVKDFVEKVKLGRNDILIYC